jgi:hypothetical protein
MKKIILFLVPVFVVINCCAQHNEFGVQISTNAFAFKGNATKSPSFINTLNDGNAYTNNPFGNKTAFNFGVHATAKHITKKKFIYGGSLGYDRFTSKFNISQSIIYCSIMPGGCVISQEDLKGFGKSTSNNITASAFAGYRLIDKKITLDVTAGFEVSYILSLKEKATASNKLNSINFNTNQDTKSINFDVRPFMQLTAKYKRFSVFESYAYGLPNYAKGKVANEIGAFSSLIRFGLGYTFKL